MAAIPFYEDTVPPLRGPSSKRAFSSSAPAWSGGEEGARHGPVAHARRRAPRRGPHIRAIFQSIAAKVDRNVPLLRLGSGESGAGPTSSRWSTTGIEYGDMQLICEGPTRSWPTALGPRQPEAGRNLHHLEPGRTRLVSHRDHLEDFSPSRTPTAATSSTTSSTPPARKAPASGTVHVRPWDQGRAPITLIAEGPFFAPHDLVLQGGARGPPSKILVGPEGPPSSTGDVTQNARGHPTRALRLQDRLLHPGLHAHAPRVGRLQVEAQLRRPSPSCGAVAVSSAAVFLGDIKAAFDRNPNLKQPHARRLFQRSPQAGAGRDGRRTVALGAQLGIAHADVLECALVLRFVSLRPPARQSASGAARTTSALTTYERTDKPRGQFFHSNWTGEGGTTSSTSYNA